MVNKHATDIRPMLDKIMETESERLQKTLAVKEQLLGMIKQQSIELAEKTKVFS